MASTTWNNEIKPGGSFTYDDPDITYDQTTIEDLSITYDGIEATTWSLEAK